MVRACVALPPFVFFLAPNTILTEVTHDGEEREVDRLHNQE